ncbi:hypothetical protein HMPREF0977_02763 [Clostridium sp. 1_1_41A1FAA]|nr:hypothetical protein HMPREF0977_02763 [Clostridium sp. 1_1_41A1FAA]
MDKNKDKRNFLDEEKEIEKLLSEFESENIKIPGELDERLNVKLKELKPKKYKKMGSNICGINFNNRCFICICT